MTDTKDPRKRFRLRRLTRFSLRTVLIATTVLAVWLGLHMNSVRKQRASIAAVLRNGGGVCYDYQRQTQTQAGPYTPAESSVPEWLLRMFGQDHFHDVIWVITKDRDGYLQNLPDLDHRDKGERSESADLLSQMDGFPKLEFLSLDSSQANDRGLRYAGQQENLRTLHLTGLVEITEHGVAHLANLNKLEQLTVFNAQFTDNAVRELARIPNLSHLFLYRCEFAGSSAKHMQELTQVRQLRLGLDNAGFTSDDLAHLKQLTQLESLHFIGSGITTDGLVHIADMQNLRSLELGSSLITEQGLRHVVGLKDLRGLSLKVSTQETGHWLQQQLPDCNVTFSTAGGTVGKVAPFPLKRTTPFSWLFERN